MVCQLAPRSHQHYKTKSWGLAQPNDKLTLMLRRYQPFLIIFHLFLVFHLNYRSILATARTSQIHFVNVPSSSYLRIHKLHEGTTPSPTKVVIQQPTRATHQLQVYKEKKMLLQWINGRRCLFVPSNNISKRNEVAVGLFDRDDFPTKGEDNQQDKLPPIIVIGGMAQSISSWEHHLPTLSKERDIFLYEYLGSGLGCRHPDMNVDNYLIVPEVCSTKKR